LHTTHFIWHKPERNVFRREIWLQSFPLGVGGETRGIPRMSMYVKQILCFERFIKGSD
jgi:hypothetical protein